MKKSTTIAMPLNLHYATLITLVIVTLCNLWMAAEFSAMYGQAIGYLSYQIENGSRVPVIHVPGQRMNLRVRDWDQRINLSTSTPTAPTNY